MAAKSESANSCLIDMLVSMLGISLHDVGDIPPWQIIDAWIVPLAAPSRLGSIFSPPPRGWARYPNLQRRPHAPNKGRGRLQRQIARAFHAHGNEVSASDIYQWCQRWQSKRFGHPERWSIVRVLRQVAEPVGRASTIGRPWLWRLKTPAADRSSATPD
jgi:hypothetical protein